MTVVKGTQPIWVILWNYEMFACAWICYLPISKGMVMDWRGGYHFQFTLTVTQVHSVIHPKIGIVGDSVTREMTVRKPCQYTEYGTFLYLLFVCLCRCECGRAPKRVFGGVGGGVRGLEQNGVLILCDNMKQQTDNNQGSLIQSCWCCVCRKTTTSHGGLTEACSQRESLGPQTAVGSWCFSWSGQCFGRNGYVSCHNGFERHDSTI